MRVKVTKTMARAIKDAVKKNNSTKKYEVYYVELLPSVFSFCVDGDLYSHDCDYNSNTSKFSVIKIEYPADYYAPSRYLTTKDLVKCFNSSNKTLEDFLQEVIDSIEV